MPRLAAIGLMLFLVFYIFAVMFTDLFKQLYHEGHTIWDYFSRLDSTIFTLFQIMTLDNWADIARQVIPIYPWAWAPFVGFAVTSAFIVVNLIIAVICDAIAGLEEADRAKIHGGGGGGEGNEDEEDSEVNTYRILEIREQLDSLEEQMEELTKIQARTFHTLQYMTRQMQMAKLKKELQNKNTTLNKQSEKDDQRQQKDPDTSSSPPPAPSMEGSHATLSRTTTPIVE